MDNFSENILSQRWEIVAEKLTGGNKAELTRLLGRKKGALYQYFYGKRKPGPEILHQLHHIGVNLNWFVAGEGPCLIQDLDSEDQPVVNDFEAPYEIQQLSPAAQSVYADLMRLIHIVRHSSFPQELKAELYDKLYDIIEHELNCDDQ